MRNLICQEVSDLAEDLLTGRAGDMFEEPVVIPVYWHTIIGETGGNITKQKIKDSIDVLNADYNGTGFQFKLKAIDYTYNPDWFEVSYVNPESKKMKESLRKGGKADLNVYTGNMSLLGYANLPQDYDKFGVLDGVVINYESVPGGSFAFYNLGKTLTHEVGHWMVSYILLKIRSIIATGVAPSV